MTHHAILGRLALAASAATVLTGCAGVDRMVRHESPCHDTSVTLYFESASDQPTDIGRQVITATARE